VLTIVHNEAVFFPIWLRYYSRFFAPDDIYVLDHETTDGSTDGDGFVRIPVEHECVDMRWLRDTIGGDVSYDDLIAGAGRWEPGVEGLLFAPYLAGERTPYPDPEARGAFLGLGLRHDRGAMTRAVLEGVAFGLRDALDLVVEMGGRPASGRVSGGGGRGMLWLEIVASVLGIPLELTRADEGAAYGAALLGGVGAGVWGDAREAVDTCVRVTRTIEPRPEWVERYAELQPAFRRVYPALVAARGD